MTDEPTTIVINGITYYLPRPVWELILKLSMEKDYWRDIAEGRSERGH